MAYWHLGTSPFLFPILEVCPPFSLFFWNTPVWGYPLFFCSTLLWECPLLLLLFSFRFARFHLVLR